MKAYLFSFLVGCVVGIEEVTTDRLFQTETPWFQWPATKAAVSS
jgi:hypothetical protein